MSRRIVLCVAAVALSGCGGRSPLFRGFDSDAEDASAGERCDGLDQDGDGRVDEDFRDAQGRYVHDQHCGGCGQTCAEPVANATEVACGLTQELPSCVAEACAEGFGPNLHGGCTALDDRVCLPCGNDGDCGALRDARCAEIGGELRCTRACGDGCPDGFVCLGRELCVPASGSCRCAESKQDFNLACAVEGPVASCSGFAECRGGVLSECRVGEERCDELDNDCDGRSDEDFVDRLGSYSLDAANCGACGVDCAADADSDAGVVLACGGDPFAPSCVTACPDRLDGVQIGDFLDADRELENGCECQVRALRDESGMVLGTDVLDADCDGADGKVEASFYVAVGGDDSGPGSPTRPLRTIGEAVQRAAASLPGDNARPDVYVAAGVYTETVRMRDGVRLHGGYRGDYLAQGGRFEVIVIAPADTAAFGGAVIVLDGAGRLPTLVEGLSLRGRDATLPSEPAVAVLITRPALSLTLRNLQVRSGKPGAGENGEAGAAGAAPASLASDGAPQRAALEDLAHACVLSGSNVVSGGVPGINVCEGRDVSGGAGGSAFCPTLSGFGPTGELGHSTLGAAGGFGGAGGRDLAGPITGVSSSCPTTVCCGLADFSVPTNFVFAQAGTSGGDGPRGLPGGGCVDPFGVFELGRFTPGFAAFGSDGGSGAGGGGGGTGSGAVMRWIDAACEFADGLGGGGGGGAGGCGGRAGAPGSSGGPAVGVLIQGVDPRTRPILEGVEITTQDGGRGGDGGAGGDGGQGGSGGFGGRLPEAARTTPSLAGPLPGERGGKGGDGGGGGAGGGGCGGVSVGIWMTGLGFDATLLAQYREANAFVLGSGGAPGHGGSGPVPAAGGDAGGAFDLVMR